ncbi:uncharacterized protein METZ01_LOCUS483072, partial [marine metagenome]
EQQEYAPYNASNNPLLVEITLCLSCVANLELFSTTTVAGIIAALFFHQKIFLEVYTS